MIHLSPYLLFDGTCRSALEFYHACFGGELTVTTVGESVLRDAMPAALHPLVLNARLKTPHLEISASDWLLRDRSLCHGNTVCLYLSGGTAEDVRRYFDRLSPGAQITDALQQMPVGLYGALNDRFGIRWMFHADV